jgi:hypothetical protein
MVRRAFAVVASTISTTFATDIASSSQIIRLPIHSSVPSPFNE